MINYLIGGRLGDFIHSLSIPKFHYENSGIKSNILISNSGDIFSNGLENTYKELIPIMESQEYVDTFKLYNNQTIFLDLSNFRQSLHIYTTCWNEIFFKTYLPLHNQEVPNEYTWLKATKIIPELKNTILVNRANRSPMNDSTKNKWNKIFEKYPDFIFQFICSNINQYNDFEFRNKMNILYCPTLEELVNCIASCPLFIGNQSTPYAIASALNKNRIVELMDTIDSIHYINDIKYYKNMSYFYGN